MSNGTYLIAFTIFSRRTPRFEESQDSLTEPLISRDPGDMPDVATSRPPPSRFFAFFQKQNLYSGYVLSLLLITYLLNQLDRYMLAIVTKPLAQVSYVSTFYVDTFLFNVYLNNKGNSLWRLSLHDKHFSSISCPTENMSKPDHPRKVNI